MTLDCTCNRLIEAERKAALWDGTVRCGECVHFRPPDDKTPSRCTGAMTFVEPTPDGFCFWGKRREDA